MTWQWRLQMLNQFVPSSQDEWAHSAELLSSSRPRRHHGADFVNQRSETSTSSWNWRCNVKRCWFLWEGVGHGGWVGCWVCHHHRPTVSGNIDGHGLFFVSTLQLHPCTMLSHLGFWCCVKLLQVHTVQLYSKAVVSMWFVARRAGSS